MRGTGESQAGVAADAADGDPGDVSSSEPLLAGGKAVAVLPELLRSVEVVRPDQAWCADITYIRMHPGWLYLVAIMDWYSRYVVSWELSNSLDESFCVAVLERALENGRAEIFNSDQGMQFTGVAFGGRLQAAQVGIIWTSTGRVFDNIFVERLWRMMKYEEVYLNEYRTVREVRSGLGSYLRFSNDRRYHRAVGNRTPRAVYEAEGLTNSLRQTGSESTDTQASSCPRNGVHPSALTHTQGIIEATGSMGETTTCLALHR